MPDPVVADGQLDEFSRPRLYVVAAVPRTQHPVRGPQSQGPPMGHGVAGVDRQVHQQLVQLRVVVVHYPEVGSGLKFDVDGSRKDPLQQPVCFGD